MHEPKEPSKKHAEAQRRGLNKARRCCDGAALDNRDNGSKAGDPSSKFRKKQTQERAWAERTAPRRAHAAALALEAHLDAQVSRDTACVNAEDLNATERSSHVQTGTGPAHAFNGKEFYAVLGVDQSATPAQIKSAFRKLSLAHHPDKGGDQRMFEMILRAKEVLCDEHLRAVYDAGGLEALSRLETQAEKMELGAGHTMTDPEENADSAVDKEDDVDWMLLAPGQAVPVGSEVCFNMTTGKTFVKTPRPTARVPKESSGGTCIL